jgi:lipoprotein-anchoring transpeptidase ErfK/SrfK
MKPTARKWGTAALTAPLVLVLVGCSGKAPWSSSNPKPSTSPPAPVEITVSPTKNAQNVPVSTEIGFQVVNGKLSDVSLTDDKNKKVSGRIRADNTSWVPDAPLAYNTTYTATVTAVGAQDEKKSQANVFTTMEEARSGPIASTVYFRDQATYGVAMPIGVQFEPEIPEKARAEVERRLFVTTDPPQRGAWAWYGGSQVLYRPQNHWQPGTTISLRAALKGLPMGNRYGDKDYTATAKISDKRTVMEVDNATKQMSVIQNDQLLRRLPVSLGKPSTPSSSGNMVIMSKEERTRFDTRTDSNPANRYVVDVQYAMRLTWGGEYIHAAPWSVGDQGFRNVSHGCINMSTEDARWLFGVVKIGDLVTVEGTEVGLDPGNGFTGWNESWEEHVKRSALPNPDLASTLGMAPMPSPTANPAVPAEGAAVSPTPPN